MALARRLKNERPDTVIVFGGPQVPIEDDDVFSRWPFIDVLVHHEGEYAFREILHERLKPIPDYGEIAGCTVNVDGCPRRSEAARRINDLGTLPSPYTEGVFDASLRDHPNADSETQ